MAYPQPLPEFPVGLVLRVQQDQRPVRNREPGADNLLDPAHAVVVHVEDGRVEGVLLLDGAVLLDHLAIHLLGHVPRLVRCDVRRSGRPGGNGRKGDNTGS